MPESSLSLKLRDAKRDAQAFEASVSSVISAQQLQIEVLTKTAEQVARETAVEQRFTSATVGGSATASRIAVLESEHRELAKSIDAGGRRGLDLTAQIEEAERHVLDLRNGLTRLEQQRNADSRRTTGPNVAKLQRTQSKIDDAVAASAKLRDEIDSLRRERLTFLSKLADIEARIDESKLETDKCNESVREAGMRRDAAERLTRQLQDVGERHSRWRLAQRQQVDQQLDAVERQARQSRNKLKGQLLSTTIAAAGGSSALHKARSSASGPWPPADDPHGLLRSVNRPRTLVEVVGVLAAMLGVEPDLEAIVSKNLAAADESNGHKLTKLNEKRAALAAREEANEKLRAELGRLESTGGGDAPQHHALREQLTELQAQGSAISASEHAQAALLEHIAASAEALLTQLRAPRPDDAPAGRAGALALLEAVEASVKGAKQRQGGGAVNE